MTPHEIVLKKRSGNLLSFHTQFFGSCNKKKKKKKYTTRKKNSHLKMLIKFNLVEINRSKNRHFKANRDELLTK